MVATNGKKPRRADEPTRLPAVPKAEVRRLSIPGEEVHIGERTYHLATLTTYGAQDLRKFIDTAAIPAIIYQDGDSIGTIMINNGLALDSLDFVAGLMQRAIYEPISEQQIFEAPPDRLAAVMDALLEQSGIQWLTRMLKNWATRVAREFETVIEEQLELQTERIRQRLHTSVPTGTESSPETSAVSS